LPEVVLTFLAPLAGSQAKQDKTGEAREGMVHDAHIAQQAQHH
jgi:hypothetical protein